MNGFSHLFMPIKINNLMLRNRVVAMPINDECSYEKATGGAGLIIMGGSFVDDPRAAYGPIPRMFDKYERMKTRANLDTFHQGGGRASLEIMHSGMHGRVAPGDFVWGPCDGVREDGTLIRALYQEEMERICREFAENAAMAKEFGFDMVMLHFAHGWLPAQFLSPAWNHRTDEYGGSYENRAKFPRMILQAVRDAVGPDFPVDMRISAYEWIPESMEFDEVVRFIKDVEPLIDMVNVSSGLDKDLEANVHLLTTVFEPHMVNVHWAAEIKKNVSIPVSVVGAIMMPEEAEEIIASGKADMVSLGRPLIADGHWPRKALEGRPEDIVPCLRCLYCYHISTDRKHVGCAVTPRYHKEELIPCQIEKAEKQKQVVVIGGGPGGMKAALTAHERGHRVVLLEKTANLGGQINCADHGVHKQELKRYRDYLRRQVNKSGIEVRLNTEAAPDMVRGMNPEVLVVAVGAEPITPPIAGVENAAQVVDVYPQLKDMKGRIVIIGGGTTGSEVGLELAERGNTVHIVEMGDKLNAQGHKLYRIAIRQHMKQCETLHTMTNAQCTEIKKDGVTVMHDGKQQFIEADHILLATGLKSKSELAHSFYGIVNDTFMIGDCDRVGKVNDAIAQSTLIMVNI